MNFSILAIKMINWFFLDFRFICYNFVVKTAGKLGMTQATASSVTFNQINPNSTIMVYDSTHLPYIARLVLQNTTLNNSQYVIANDVTIGRQAESSRTFGDVTVSDDACYEIESAGKVTIEGGFNVELGASFAIYTSSYK